MTKEDAIRIAAQIGLFGLARAGSTAGMMASAVAGGLGGNGGGGTRLTGNPVADGMVADQYPSKIHTVDVNYVPGPPQLNAMLQRGIADRASKMQTLSQHNNTLLKYVRPNMDPKSLHLAIMRGQADEEALPEYWDDKKPRVDYTPSSSAVTAIRITPDHRVEVMWGSTPKWYTYKQHADQYEAALAAHKLLTAPSIGRALIRKSRKPGIGGWGRAQYDGAMAR